MISAKVRESFSTNATDQLDIPKEILYCKQDIKYNKRNIVQTVNHKDFFFFIYSKKTFPRVQEFGCQKSGPDIEKNVKWVDIGTFFTIYFKQFVFVLPLCMSPTTRQDITGNTVNKSECSSDFSTCLVPHPHINHL